MQTTYTLPLAVKTELDRIERAAGASGPLEEARWPSELERNYYPVQAGETHENLRLSGGRFVGVWSTSYGAPVDNLTLRNVEIVNSLKWAMRPYQWRDAILIEDCTVAGVLDEHGLYPTMIGRGTYEEGEERPPATTPALTLRRVHWSYIGSQVVQLTGPRHLIGQQVGTAPNGTSFPFEQADTWGGPIVIEDNYAVACCIWGGRPAFAYSIREAKHHVIGRGIVIDNRQFQNSRGGVLLEGSRDFKRAANIERLIVLLPNADKASVQVDYWSHMTFKNWAIFTENEKPITINGPHKGSRIRFIDCVGNVRVKVNGEDIGPITANIDITV